MKRILTFLLLLPLVADAQAPMEYAPFMVQRVVVTGSSPTPDILWWKFTDGSGSTVTAAVGQNGSTDCAWVTGKSGSGYALDANGTSQEAATSSAVSYSTNIVTLSYWIYPDATSTQIYLESGPSSTANAFTIYIYNTKMRAYIGGTTGAREEAFDLPPTGAWTHHLVVLDASTTAGEIYFYTNGVENTASTLAINTKTGTSNLSDQTLFVLARSGPSLYANGRLDDIRIYSGNRSSSVSSIFNDPQ